MYFLIQILFLGFFRNRELQDMAHSNTYYVYFILMSIVILLLSQDAGRHIFSPHKNHDSIS